jgi:hypothetical protein
MEVQPTNYCYSGQGFHGGSVLENAGTLTLDDDSRLGICSDTNAANAIVNDAGATISYAGSTADASAELRVPIIGKGTITISEGTLAVQDLVPKSHSHLTVGAGSAPGEIAVSSAMHIAGTLTIRTPKNYLPPIGTTLNVLVAPAVSGVFSSVRGTQLTGEHWVVSYTASSVVLTAASG